MSRFERIHEQLSNTLSPSVLIIEDESHQHSRPGVETHFKVIVATKEFRPLPRIERYRLVHSLLQEEFKTGLHALSLYLYTPEEWEQKNTIPTTPNCQHVR